MPQELSTFFDLSQATTPFITATGGANKGCHATVRGFTVQGVDRRIEAGGFGGAAFLDATDASVWPDNLVFENVHFEVGAGADANRGLIYADGGSVSVTDTVVTGMDLQVSSAVNSFNVEMAPFVRANGASVLFGAVTLEEVTATIDLPDQHWFFGGLMVSARSSNVEIYDSAVSGMDATFTCGDGTGAQGLLAFVSGGSLVAERWTIDDVNVQLSGDQTVFSGLVLTEVATGRIEDVEMTSVDIELDAEDSSLLGGGFYVAGGDGLSVARLTAVNNRFASGSSTSSRLFGGLINAFGPASFQNLDIRGNTVEGYAVTGGLLNLVASDSETMVENAILAGNSIGTFDTNQVKGGLIHVDELRAGLVTLSHLDALENTVEGGSVTGGSLAIASTSLLGHSSNFSFNTVSGTTVNGAVVHAEDAGAVTWRQTNVFSNSGGAAFSGFATDPSGSLGNQVENPQHTDLSGKDPVAWDLTLAKGSALIDAGDPSETDPDGSASDMGAYGGPQGDAW